MAILIAVVMGGLFGAIASLLGLMLVKAVTYLLFVGKHNVRIVNVVNFILLFVTMIELSIRGFALFKIFCLCATQSNISPNSELKKS